MGIVGVISSIGLFYCHKLFQYSKLFHVLPQINKEILEKMYTFPSVKEFDNLEQESLEVLAIYQECVTFLCNFKWSNVFRSIRKFPHYDYLMVLNQKF